MTKAGKRMIEGAKEAVAVARGEQPAVSITVAGHAYVPRDRWQPIETAPRDGTHILLYIPYNNGPIIVVGFQTLPDHLQDMRDTWSWSMPEAGSYAEDATFAGLPTHWMPLPAPPSAFRR